MKESISNVEYTSLMYDFYGGLLDDSKREIMDLYHEDNLSLTEIAAEGILENYEDALGLVAVWKNNNELVAEADSLVEKMQSIDDDAELHGALARMNEILHKALDL